MVRLPNMTALSRLPGTGSSICGLPTVHSGASGVRPRPPSRDRTVGIPLRRRAPPPPPEPGTWRDHPPLPPVIDQAAADLAAGSSHRTVLAGLECDPGDRLAGALASLGRTLFGPQ